jgi:hypothetical protein
MSKNAKAVLVAIVLLGLVSVYLVVILDMLFVSYVYMTILMCYFVATQYLSRKKKDI